MWPEYCIIGLLLIACLVLCAENLDLRRELRDVQRGRHVVLLNCHHPGWQFHGEPDYWADKANPVPTVNLTMPDVCAKTDTPEPNGDPEDKIE